MRYTFLRFLTVPIYTFLRFLIAHIYTFLRFIAVQIYTFLRFFASVTLKTYWWCNKTVIICDYIFVSFRIFIYSS